MEKEKCRKYGQVKSLKKEKWKSGLRRGPSGFGGIEGIVCMIIFPCRQR